MINYKCSNPCKRQNLYRYRKALRKVSLEMRKSFSVLMEAAYTVRKMRNRPRLHYLEPEASRQSQMKNIRHLDGKQFDIDRSSIDGMCREYIIAVYLWGNLR